MIVQPGVSKVTAAHLQRDAIVYVRQSSKLQVKKNTASADQQKSMADVARALGWERSRIHIIDKDQGLSGASTLKREGFKEMLERTISGSVGAIFAL